MSIAYISGALILGWVGGALWENRKEFRVVRAHRGLAALYLLSGAAVGGFVVHYLCLRGVL